MKNNILKYQNPSMVIPGGVTYPIKKLLEIVAKNSWDAQAKSGKEIITDVITGRNPSFYAEETIDGGNEIDTYLYGTPYNTENTSNVGPSYDAYLSKNFPLRKHDVKTYDAHFGDTLYIDKKYKDQVLDELEQGKTVGASMGRYAHAPSYIINTKDDKRRHYDAGGHLMQFQYDQNGNVVANMSDIYDFLPKDFEDKYGAVKEYGPLKTAAMYTMHYSGTPFVVRQNNIPVRFKEIVPEYKTEWQQRLGDFLSQWGDTYDLTLPLKLTDEEIFQIFADKEYGDDILNFMFQEGYLQPKQFKRGGSIHIKKKNRGKFTDYCGGKVTEECIAKGKKSKDPKIRKRATFAANARKWKHENGGILKAQEGTGNLLTPHPLSPIGIALNQAKAIAKMKGDQQHLPPGVKEVVGPDGKKVAIRTEQPLVPLEQSIAEWLPGTGDVAEVGYIANDIKNGNLGNAALAAAMIALPGNVGKILRKGDTPPVSKLTWEEKLGIPKGERNQPAKPRSTRAIEYDITPEGLPTKEFLDDFETYKKALSGEGRKVDITDMFDSSWYRERLAKQGLTEEQANQLISRLKARTGPDQIMVTDGLNYVRDFSHAEKGIPIGMTPERTTQLGRHSTHPSFNGKSLIQLTTKVDPEDVILHEIGGHRSQSLVSDFAHLYDGQKMTDLGMKHYLKVGAPSDYGVQWGEVRARALAIAKQMSDAGWNPNSPEQVNVWLNKHIFTNNPTNVNQGALYYDRPSFIKMVSEGLKKGGKLPQ